MPDVKEAENETAPSPKSHVSVLFEGWELFCFRRYFVASVKSRLKTSSPAAAIAGKCVIVGGGLLVLGDICICLT